MKKFVAAVTAIFIVIFAVPIVDWYVTTQEKVIYKQWLIGKDIPLYTFNMSGTLCSGYVVIDSGELDISTLTWKSYGKQNIYLNYTWDDQLSALIFYVPDVNSSATDAVREIVLYFNDRADEKAKWYEAFRYAENLTLFLDGTRAAYVDGIEIIGALNATDPTQYERVDSILDSDGEPDATFNQTTVTYAIRDRLKFIGGYNNYRAYGVRIVMMKIVSDNKVYTFFMEGDTVVIKPYFEVKYVINRQKLKEQSYAILTLLLLASFLVIITPRREGGYVWQ